MSEIAPRHLVLVRHGESEGDVRRSAVKSGRHHPLIKHPKDELQTARGHEQMLAASQWISRFVLHAYGINGFDFYATSPLPRVVQSAQSLDLSSNWHKEPLLTERDRGLIQGLTKAEHKEKFPKSYQQMIDHPFYWTPPEGESILKVADRAKRFFDGLTYSNALVMAHRDFIWASMVTLDNLTLEQVVEYDTDQINNAQIFHLTNVNPYDGSVTSENLSWRRTACPWLIDRSGAIISIADDESAFEPIAA